MNLEQLEQLLATALPPIDTEVIEEERQLRDKRFMIYLSASELEDLKSRANGIKLSTYIRTILLNQPRLRPRPAVPQVNRDAYIELGRIGANLNQQTRALHRDLAQGKLSESDTIFSYLQQLQDMTETIQEIRKQLIPDIELSEIENE